MALIELGGGETDRQTDGQTDGQTDRWTDGQRQLEQCLSKLDITERLTSDVVRPLSPTSLCLSPSVVSLQQPAAGPVTGG